MIGYSDNLHSDWDTYIPETLVGGYALSDALSWANDLIKEIDSGDYKSQAASWISGDAVASAQDTAMAWASDANAYVCTVVMPDGAAALTAMSDLYPTYYDSVVPTIELQVAKGGYRLGNWVRACLSFPRPDPEVPSLRACDDNADRGHHTAQLDL